MYSSGLNRYRYNSDQIKMVGTAIVSAKVEQAIPTGETKP